MNEIKTKFGNVYIEDLSCKRNEQDRIKIYDSNKKYIDYFSVESMLNYATKQGILLKEEYVKLIDSIREADTINELINRISTSIIIWFKEPLTADETKKLKEYEDFINKIGDYWLITE